jgi:hypothetical protein
MEKHIPPSETRYDDLNGSASVKLRENFITLAEKIAGVDTTKYKPVALRAYYYHDDLVITVYASILGEAHRPSDGKQKVKVFKVHASPFEFIEAMSQMDCTLVTEGVKVEDFEVIN